MTAAQIIQREIEVRAYVAGFREGVAGGRGRHVVDPGTHEHFKVGFEDGHRALERSEDEYRKTLSIEETMDQVALDRMASLAAIDAQSGRFGATHEIAEQWRRRADRNRGRR